MVRLLELPRECLSGILLETSHHDLARLRQCCKMLDELITGDHLLYKWLYLNCWDEPPPGFELRGKQWKVVGERFAHMVRVLEHASWGTEGDTDEGPDMVPVAESIVEFLRRANSQGGPESRNATALAELFKSEVNKDMFLGNSSTYCRSHKLSKKRAERRFRAKRLPMNGLSAKLHCLYGVPILDDWYQEKEGYPFACSRTYDLRNYRLSNCWGPFENDGSLEVDWEKLEAAMAIIGWNFKRYHHSISKGLPKLWRKSFEGAWANSYQFESTRLQRVDLLRPFPKSGGDDDNPVSGDPYGITGTWMRIICFLDFHDFFRFNFGPIQPPPDEPRPPISLPEATRILITQVIATKIEPPGEEDGQDMPVVHFRGISTATHHPWDLNSSSALRGTVRQTKEGEIRWTSYSVYEGEERWKTEGIQVGGVRSGRGVFGHWFDKNHDPEGPTGPTAFWKISDQYDRVDEETKGQGTKRIWSGDDGNNGYPLFGISYP